MLDLAHILNIIYPQYDVISEALGKHFAARTSVDINPPNYRLLPLP